MRVLLDTNILIHREASTVVRGDIGNVFFWLDRLKHDKCAHPVSVAEIEKHKDEKVRRSFAAKLQSYNILKTARRGRRRVRERKRLLCRYCCLGSAALRAANRPGSWQVWHSMLVRPASSG